jgi:ankyrin repeat protein
MDVAPIQEAIKTGDAARVRELIAEDPDLLTARTEQGVSMISLSCYYRQPAIAAIFMECGGILDIFDACAVGDQERVQKLVDAFPHSIGAYSQDGFYPLGLAAFFGHAKIVEFLLDAGADVNQVAKNAFKVAPLHAAVSNGDIGIVRLLLERGADVNARQQNGFTPLHGAAAAGRKDICDLLLQYGADPDAVTDDGKRVALV